MEKFEIAAISAVAVDTSVQKSFRFTSTNRGGLKIKNEIQNADRNFLRVTREVNCYKWYYRSDDVDDGRRGINKNLLK